MSERDVVVLKLNWRGRGQVFLNGELVEKFTRKSSEFPLPDGRVARVDVNAKFGSSPIPLLTVDGELAYRTVEGKERRCDSCQAVVAPYDKYCDACGAQLPKPEAQLPSMQLGEAAKGVRILSVLFVISGVVMWLIQKGKIKETLQTLDQYPDSAPWSVPVNGEIVTVGELRRMVLFEVDSILWTNLLLAAIMLGLYFWARVSPLPAVLSAAAVYLAVIVLSAIVDPTSITQGIVVKIVVLTILGRGIKAGFQQRAQANAG